MNIRDQMNDHTATISDRVGVSRSFTETVTPRGYEPKIIETEEGSIPQDLEPKRIELERNLAIDPHQMQEG